MPAITPVTTKIQSTIRMGHLTLTTLWSAVLMGVFCGCGSTVTTDPTSPPLPVAEANQTTATVTTPPAAVSRRLPVLFIVGDSTVHNSAPGLLGWGDVLGGFFDPQKMIVENHAKPGRSSRTFQTQGWWAEILAKARPGDFVLIQMGHNDGGPLDDTNRARGTIPGIGDDSREIYNPLMHRPEQVHTYGWYLRQYIAEARAKGMIPLLCSPVPRMPQHMPPDTNRDPHVAWSEEVAADQKVCFINLNRLILEHYSGLTTNQIKAQYFTLRDNTHSSPAGARLNAGCLVEGLRQLPQCPLADYLLNPSPPAND